MNAGRTVLVLALAAASASALAVEGARQPVRAPVISHSRQFFIYADDDLLASALAAFAERVKRGWLQQLDLADAWRDPIVLVVRERRGGELQTPAVSVRCHRTDIHLKHQIDITTPPPISATNLLPALVEALCAELANRHVLLPYGQPYVATAIPAWLRDGLATSLAEATEELVQTAGARWQSGGWPAAMSVLAGNADGDGIASWLFVEALLTLPRGGAKLQEFLTTLPSGPDAVAAFWKAYGGDFPSVRALEKWWALQVLRRATATVAQNWTAAETRTQLAAVLTTRVRRLEIAPEAAKVVELPLEQLSRYADAPWFASVVRNKQARLEVVWAQGHPLYRPVVARYRAALEFLSAGSVRRFRDAIRAARAEQRRLEVRLAAIGEYLAGAEARHVWARDEVKAGSNWELWTGLERLPRRRSPISDYLNRFDR